MSNKRWSENREIDQMLTRGTDIDRGGLVLKYLNGQRWVYSGEGHSLTLGETGSGKTRRGTIPLILTLIEAAESFISLDSKPEIVRYTEAAARRKGYDVHIIDFSCPYRTEGVNLLSLPYDLYHSHDEEDKQEAEKLIEELANSILPIEGDDPFWPKTGRDLFLGAIRILFEFGTKEQANMASIYEVISKGLQRVAGRKTALQAIIQELPEGSLAESEMKTYLTAPNDTACSMLATFFEGMAIFFKNEGLKEMLSSDHLRIKDLDVVKPVGIFIILPDETSIFDNISGILCNQIIKHYLGLARRKYGDHLPRRLNVAIEELASVGKAIPELPKYLASSRSKGVRFQLVLQTLPQLASIYGEKAAETITDNVSVWQVYRINNSDTRDEISKMCGSRRNEAGKIAPVVSSTAISDQWTGKRVVMISGKTRKVKYTEELPDFTEMFPTYDWEELPRKRWQHISPVPTFNLLKCLDELKHAKLLDTIDRRIQQLDDDPPEKTASHPTSGFSEIESEFEAFLDSIDEREKSVTEESKKSQNNSTPEVLSEQKPFFIHILDVRGSNKLELAEAIRDTSTLSLEEAKDIVNSLPKTLRFDSIDEGQRALREIIKSGGIVLPGNVGETA